MKYASIIFAIQCLLLIGCSTVYFETPQPQGYEALDSFPDDYLGTYLQGKDTMYIVSDGIKGYEYESRSIPISSLDTIKTVRLNAGKVYDKDYSDTIGLAYEINNDTLNYKYRILESMSLSDSLILKKFKNYLVLNKLEGADWFALLIKKNKNGLVSYDAQIANEDSLSIENVIDKNRLKTIESSVNPRNGKDSYLINPTAKEFKNLIKKGFYTELEFYKKIE